MAFAATVTSPVLGSPTTSRTAKGSPRAAANLRVLFKARNVDFSSTAVNSERRNVESSDSRSCHAVSLRRTVLTAAAGVALMVSPAWAGPLSDLLPDSAPPAPVEKFERDLGEGRKLRVKDAESPKDTEVGRLPAPLPYAKAKRADIEMEADPGYLPGIGKEAPKSSVAAPLSYSTPRPQT